jgi:hypothetical protein
MDDARNDDRQFHILPVMMVTLVEREQSLSNRNILSNVKEKENE